MTKLEQTLIREISTLPEARLADVIAFVRFLKTSLPDKERARSDFKESLKDVRATAKKNKISEEDIENEIRAVREAK